MKGRTGWTKKPRGVHEEHHGALKRLLGSVYCSVPVLEYHVILAGIEAVADDVLENFIQAF